MRANWLYGRFCVYASSFENYIAEEALKNSFVQQSLQELKKNIHQNIIKLCLKVQLRDKTYMFKRVAHPLRDEQDR